MGVKKREITEYFSDVSGRKIPKDEVSYCTVCTRMLDGKSLFNTTDLSSKNSLGIRVCKICGKKGIKVTPENPKEVMDADGNVVFYIDDDDEAVWTKDLRFDKSIERRIGRII